MSGAALLSARELRVERRSRRGSFTLQIDALDLRAGEVLAILGPNGAGKSTLLRALAGLEHPARGAIDSAAAGPITLVFQRPAAFAGSVAHNVAAALLGRGLERAQLERRVREALERFEIASLAPRRAHTLSGGELRRLALARAFVLAPAVLLLDEPFDDLDASGQASLSLDLRRAIGDTGVAVAMVTHDLRRALLLADRIAVLLEGRLAQIDRRDSVLEKPRTPEIARVVGMSNLVRGVVVAAPDGGRRVEVDAHHAIPVRTALETGCGVWAGIRPEHLKIDVGRGGSGIAIGKAVVRSVVDDGVAASVALAWAGEELHTHLLAGRGLARSLEPGALVVLAVQPEHVHLIPVAEAPRAAG
ncbi:MAG: ABC transporter ATP-binding protein [Myxococcales bacterium]|nr:ABC transporter ATP-binding protein [Myxococcales bacterium]MDH5305590.1 ABC transporter ATP-binding protein [Myxococcales bacterium]MDH5565236.1 ABC transporter ATP-binding protein [Myxococcales bacterium]